MVSSLYSGMMDGLWLGTSFFAYRAPTKLEFIAAGGIKEASFGHQVVPNINTSILNGKLMVCIGVYFALARLIRVKIH